MALSFSSADSATLLTQLGLWAAKTTVLAVAAGFGLTVFPAKSISWRLFTWTAVLYAAFAIPLLGWLLPPLPIALPTPPHRAVASPSDGVPPLARGPRSAVGAEASAAAPSAATATLLPSASPRSLSFEIHWTALATALYLAIFLLLVVRIAVGLMLSRRLGQVAKQIHDPRMISSLARRAEFHGLYSAPPVCESGFVSVPVTIGVLRPSILLPLGWQHWDDEKLDSILAHEMSHVARHDPWTQCISVLHRAIFWFNPFSWWLNRHLADLAEQASDEAALSQGADRDRYARTLLGFFETIHLAPVRVWWQGVSMARASQAEHRVQRILAWRGAFTMHRKRSAMVAIIACAIPLVFLAAAAQPADHNQVPPNMFSAQQQQPTPPVSDSEMPTPAASSAVPPTPAATENGMATAPFSPSPQWPAPGHDGVSYAYGFDDDEQRFVIVSGKSDRFTMSGSMDDVHHVEKLKKQIAGDFIWFARDEKSYIIRDPATIERARKLWLPQQELGKKQEELGRQQEALGKQQEDLGKKMEQIRVNVPDMTAELDRLKAKLQKLGSGATMEQIGDLQSEIGELQSKIGEIQSQAGAAQSKLGEQQGMLGEKQGRLGEQQGEFGRQQAELARQATTQMKQLLDEALKNGTAKPEPQLPHSSTL